MTGIGTNNKSDFLIKLFAFSIPFTAFGIINTSDFGFDLALLLAIFFAGKYIADTLLKGKVIVNKIDKLLLLFLLIAFFSILTAIATGPADIYRMFKQMVLLTIDCALFLYLRRYFINNPKSLLPCLKYYIFSACFVILFGLYQFLSGIFELPYPHTLLKMAYNASMGIGKHSLIYDVPIGGFYRIESIFAEPGGLALFLLGCIPLFLYSSIANIRYPFRKRILNNMCFILGIFILLSTFSLSGYIGLCLMGALLVFDYVKNKKQFKIFKSIKPNKRFFLHLLIFIVIIISCFVNTHFRKSSQRIMTRKLEGIISSLTTESKSNISAIAYLQTVATSRNIMLHRPFFGAGYGNYENYFNLYRLPWFFDMNVIAGTGVFFRILAETGIIGAVVFLWFFIVLLRKSHSVTKKVKDAELYPILKGVWLALICYSINFLLVRSNNINSLQFWFLLSLVGAISTLKLNERKQNKT